MILFGAWFAIKIAGNYQYWSDVVLGRARFYVFLLGSILLFTASVGWASFLIYSYNVLIR
jgi:hypothetical protein